MADLKNMVVGVLLFITIVGGFYSIFNSWYSATGSTATLDSSKVNFSQPQSYLANWANQTASLIKTGSAFDNPLIGGSFTILTGGFQVITLILGFPGQVISPILGIIFGASALNLPQWFITFAGILIFVSISIWIVNALKGGGNI